MIQIASATISAPPATASIQDACRCARDAAGRIFVQHRYREHARQHMRAAPTARIAGMLTRIEAQRRHAERAGRDRHEGADRRHEAGEEHGERAAAVKERLALRDQPRIIRQRPGAEDLALRRGGRSRRRCRRRALRRRSAAASTPESVSSPPGTNALRARMMVDPGTNEPSTGTASSSAARNSVR